MKQVVLLKKIINAPNIFPTESARARAKRNLIDKMNRRDRNLSKRSQLTFTFKHEFNYPDWVTDV
jgi:hypothetical protein